VLQGQYRPAIKLPPNERPRLFTGAKISPDSIWLPAINRTPPAGARLLASFEQPTWDPWKRSGAAWGKAPVEAPVAGQPLVLGASGTRFATSMHDGDASTGRITTAPFPLDGTRITMFLGGGTDATKLRVELWVDNALIAVTSVPEPGGQSLREVSLAVPVEYLGRPATLVFVDDSPHGHLTVDDVWIWD
jgi:hypothetical protein